MLQKEEVVNLIKSVTNEENKSKLQKYLDMIEAIDDIEWEKFAKENSLDTLEKLSLELEKRLSDNRSLKENAEENNYPFIMLNDLVSYGITGDTLHIHLIPPDVHNLLNRRGLVTAEMSLIDALEQIREIIKDKSEIKTVYAVSGIMQSLIARMFIGLNFDVKVLPMEEAKNDRELGVFYERFNRKNLDKLGRASMPREVLISGEWENKKEKRKETLQKMQDRLERRSTYEEP